MVGGTVVEVIVSGDRVWINCEERQTAERAAIYVKATARARSISEGDSVWWQSDRAMWTPAFNRGKKGLKCGVDYDIRLERIGFSGAARPMEATK